MSSQILSIDIGHDVIAAVLFNMGLKVNTIVRTAVAMVPDGETSETGSPLVHALMQIKEQIKPDAADVVVTIPADGVLYRNLQVPFKENHKIRQVLPFELEPLLPIGIDDLKIDFHKNHVGDSTEVLAVAVDRERLQEYLDALASANLNPQLVVPGGFPFAAYLTGDEDRASEKYLILDVGTDKTTVIAINAGRIIMVRRMPSELDSEQSAEALALRIRQTITALNDNNDDFFSPSCAYVTGPGIKTEDAFQRLSLALDELPTEILDLLPEAPRLAIVDNVEWDPFTMTNAFALAILELEGRPCANFHRIHSPLRNYWNAYRPYVVGPAVLLGVALFIGLSGVLIDSYLLNKRLQKINDQIKQVYLSTFPGSSIKGKTDPLDLMESKIKALKKEGSTPGRDPNQPQTMDVLLEVSRLIPKNIDVLLTRMTVGGGSVTISGETTAFNSVDEIKSKVEKSQLFRQVTIASANMEQSGNKVRFRLKIDL